MATAAPDSLDCQQTESKEPEMQNGAENDMSCLETSGSDEGLGKFLQRMKTDMMYELRNIQHSHRPVTGQEHRENLYRFMKKHVCDDNTVQGNVPANVDDVAEHRPQSVLVEVQGIVEQRPVSSILQSAAFRHRLENIIRGSIQSTTRRPVAASSRGRPSAAPPVETRAIFAERNAQPRSRSPVPRLARRDSTDSISSVESFSSALSSADRDDDFVDEEAASLPVSPAVTNTEHSPSPVPVPRRSLGSSVRVSPAPIGPSARAHSHRNGHEEAEVGLSWNDISQVHREELVQELSELLHTRLVSSTLEGEFRATLEVLIENRVDSNGPEVEQFVQSLPGRGIPRNDFSHLGIENINEVDNSDNISIASVSAHSVPYTLTNTFLGREIQSLKAQMKQMLSMVKLTHELQLDIQRSIRQEVSAALAQSSSGEGASAAPCAHPARSARPVQDTHCLICLDSYSDSVLYQCGHMCVCYFCGKDLISRKLCCPVCRAPIKDVIRAYKTNVE